MPVLPRTHPSVSLKRPRIQRARLTHIGRRVGVEAVAERIEPGAVPDCLNPGFGHVAEVQPVRCRDHATRHRVALVRDITAGPRPRTARPTRCAGWVLAWAGPWQA